MNSHQCLTTSQQDHACITPRRIDSASALLGSAVERHLTARRGRHFMGRSIGVGHGRGWRWAAVGPSCRRRWSRRRHRCRGGGAGRRAHPGVGAAAGVPGCAVGHTRGAGRPGGGEVWHDTRGPDDRARGEVGRDARGPMAKRQRGQKDGRAVRCWLDLVALLVH
jgi:hypothetical protein